MKQPWFFKHCEAQKFKNVEKLERCLRLFPQKMTQISRIRKQIKKNQNATHPYRTRKNAQKTSTNRPGCITASQKGLIIEHLELIHH